MDGEKFDDLIRKLATIRMTRMDALRGMVAGAAATVTGATSLDLEDAEAKKKAKAAGKKGGNGKGGRGGKKKRGNGGKQQPTNDTGGGGGGDAGGSSEEPGTAHGLPSLWDRTCTSSRIGGPARSVGRRCAPDGGTRRPVPR